MKTLKAVAIVALFAALVTPLCAQDSAQPWSRRMADSVIARWPDGDMPRAGGPAKIGDWAYDKNVVFAGMTEIWQNTADPAYFRYIQRSMDRLITPDGGIPAFGREENSLDEIALGRELLMLYGRTRNVKYYKAASIIRHQLEIQPRNPSGGFWHKQRYPNQMWLDSLYMAEPFYAQWAAMFQEPQDFDDIAKQFTLVEDHLRDPKTGLLYHGWDESKQQAWANKQTGASPNFWGRALGWYAMALVDTIPYFPQDHPGRAKLLAILNRLAPAIVAVQDKDSGVWYQVLDKPKAAGNYLEASASCMFTYALAKGVRLGYLDPKYQANATRAWAGIQKQFITTTADGNSTADGKPTLSGTVYGAGLGGNPYRDGTYDYYIHEKVGPDDPKGVGAFLLAAAEMDLAPTATLARGKTVLLDAWFNSQKREDASGKSNYFHYKWNDLADSGFSTFGHTFRSFGAATETHYGSPRTVTTPTVGRPDVGVHSEIQASFSEHDPLAKASLYILVSPDIPARNPNPHYMDKADADAIVKWVKAGGVLLILENDVVNSEFEHFNLLTDRFGMHYNAVTRNPVEGNKYEQGKIEIPAGTLGFTHPHTIYQKEISTLTLQAPARPVLTHNGDVVAATAKIGKGMVYAMCDPWLYNEYTDGIKLPPQYDQLAAGKELVRWLLEQAPKR